MKTISRFCMICLILICSNLAYADSIVFCDQTYTIFYSPITSKVYLSSTGDFSTSDLLTIDPITVTEENNFYVGGFVKSVIPTDGGVNLLLLLSNVDGDTSSNDGVLRKIDSSTGTIVPGYEVVFDDLPLTMVADSNQTYLYVAWGLDGSVPATINKIRISDFQIMSSAANYGYKPDSIALTNDNSKLYLKNDLISDNGYSRNIGVINTADMSLIGEISAGNIMPFTLKMGYDNRLFVSNPVPMQEFNNEISLIVIDTLTDEVIENISMGEQGITDIEIDMVNHKLYGTACPRDYYIADWEAYVHRSTEIIVQFDLDDPTYTPSFFTLGEEGLWDIAIALIPGSSKIFAIAKKSEVVYYMDL